MTTTTSPRDALALHGFQYSGGGAGTDFLFLAIGPWEIILTECEADGPTFDCMSRAPSDWDRPVLVGLYGRDSGDPIAHTYYATLLDFFATLPNWQ